MCSEGVYSVDVLKLRLAGGRCSLAGESPAHARCGTCRGAVRGTVQRGGAADAPRLRTERPVPFKSGARRRVWVQENGGVLWLPDQDAVPVQDRSDGDGNTRNIDQGPPQELTATAVSLTEDSFGVGTEGSACQVSRALGFGTTDFNIHDHTERVAEAMEETGQLI